MPSVHQSHHDAELCISGQVAEIGAVVAVLGHIAVARIEIYARLNTVNLVCAVPVIHQVFTFSIVRAIGFYISASISIIDKHLLIGFAVKMLSV